MIAMNSQIQKSPQTSKQYKHKEKHNWYIIIKVLKTNDTERNPQCNQRKEKNTLNKGIKVKMNTDFLSERI